MLQEPLTIVVDLGAPGDVLWDERLLRALRQCAGFESIECQVRGGAVLVGSEYTSSVEYGPRINGLRIRGGHSEYSTRRFYEQNIAKAFATTEPLTDFDLTALTDHGRYSWDVFTLSHVPSAFVDDVLTQVGAQSGFLHAARPDPTNARSYRLFWANLGLVGYINHGRIVRTDTEDDPEESVQRGYCPSRRPRKEAADGFAIDLEGFMLMPERRLTSVPIPLPLVPRPIGAEGRKPLRDHRDAVARAAAQLPAVVKKTHDFDDHEQPARFELSSGPADRMPDYWQVEAKVRNYCLVEPSKRAGFEALGIVADEPGVAAIADQLLGCVNNAATKLIDPRVMSDGTLQFSQAIALSGPRGHVGAVSAAWNWRPGGRLRLSSAHRTSTDGTLGRAPSVPRWCAETDDWDRLLDTAMEAASRAMEGCFVSGGEAFGIILVPVGNAVDQRTASFSRSVRRSTQMSCRVSTLKRQRYLSLYGVVPGRHETEVVTRACAIADFLRASGVRAYPHVLLN